VVWTIASWLLLGVALLLLATLALLLGPWSVDLRLEADARRIVQARIRSRLLPPLMLRRVLYPTEPKGAAAIEPAKKQAAQKKEKGGAAAGSGWARAKPYLLFFRRHVLPQLGRRLHRLTAIVSVERMEVDAEVGLDDPELNGYICVARETLTPLLPGLSGLRVNFAAPCLSGSAELGVLLRPFQAAALVAGVVAGTGISWIREKLRFNQRRAR